MELNIPAATTTTTTLNSNQENNQLLLNAIKNKFAAQTATEAAAFSPPKFNIPLLKIPAGRKEDISSVPEHSALTSSTTPANTQLNQFLLKQLQEKHTNQNASSKEHTGFVLPQLQAASNNSAMAAMKFEIPTLKPQAKDSKISSLTTAINKLQVQDSKTEASVPLTANIDLTTALACKLRTHQGTPPTRDFVKTSNSSPDNEPDFVIPFIDCDRLDLSRKHALLLPLSNEYCVTDISKLMLQHSLVEPSVIGQFLCLAEDKYSAPLPLECLSREYRQQVVKHHIEPFRFETKSPDDLVLEALNKYQMRHYN